MSTTFPLRTAGLPLTQALGKLVEMNVNVIAKSRLLSGIVDPLFEEHNALKDYGIHMVRQLLAGNPDVHEMVYVYPTPPYLLRRLPCS